MFFNSLSNYRVVSCILLDDNPEIQLNQYKNFTISGTNLNNIQINQEANLIIEPDENGKYPGSYVLVGYEGIGFKEKEIEVNPKYEYEILCRLMTEEQAKNVNKAYPSFVYLVLNGKQDEIDYKNINNVGKKRLNLYIQKVQSDCRIILFYPVCFENGITSSEDIQKLQVLFNSPEELHSSLKQNPYRIYISILGYSFYKADKLVKTYYSEFIDSKIRCEYGCLEILKENESFGDTRLNANLLAQEVKKIAPETQHHIVETVKNSKLIHYDENTKYASIEKTYQDELLIAENIIYRLNNPTSTPMDWEQYIEVNGFGLTEEQQEILKTVQNNNIVILTGSAGSGKSSSMKALIRMLEGYNYSYTMLCPTGTASKVLSKATGRKAYTIHMFLAKEMICGDFLLIEESSMVGVSLLADLLKSIPESTKIIFICDPSQLPSISCGNIVHDILSSNMVPNVNLTKIFRYNSSGLITVATDTRNGKSNSFINNYSDYHFIETEQNSVMQVVEAYGEALDKGYSKNDILILTPFNKTNKGTYAINEAIQKKYNQKEFTNISIKHDNATIKFKIGDRVINKKNNYHVPILEFDEFTGQYMETAEEMFIANGSIGIIRQYYKVNNVECLAIEFDEGVGLFSGTSISNLLLGYAVTVHASQGNQAKAVIVLFDKEHKRMLNRGLEYVAFTRSQKELWVIGDKEIIKDGMEIEETEIRDTWLGEMLKEEFDE